jgi:hypothetical protein
MSQPANDSSNGGPKENESTPILISTRLSDALKNIKVQDALYLIGLSLIVLSWPITPFLMLSVIYETIVFFFTNQNPFNFDEIQEFSAAAFEILSQNKDRFLWYFAGFLLLFIGLSVDVVSSIERIIPNLVSTSGKVAYVIIGLIWLNYSRQNALSDINAALGINPGYAVIILNFLTGIHFLISPDHFFGVY